MERKYLTTLGGADRRFMTTQWTEILNAGQLSSARKKEFLDVFVRKYWRPVYCFLRKKDFPNEKAKDLTQGFIQDIVLDRSLIEKADKSRGRFRTFILTALTNYIADVHKKETAKKRHPGEGVYEFEISSIPDKIGSSSEMTPDDVYNYVWAVEVLDDVMDTVKNWFYTSGKRSHWDIFHARIVEPIISNKKPPSIERLCERYKIASAAQASNMISYVKKYFHTAMYDYLGRMVEDRSDIEMEYNDIFKILSR